MSGLESKIESALKDYAKSKGVLTFKFISPGTPGVPDRIFIGPTGKVGFLEVKAPGRIPDRLQMRILNDLIARGCNAGWTDSIAAGKRHIDDLIEERSENAESSGRVSGKDSDV